MDPRSTLRRIAASGGPLALLAALAMAATAVLVGAPRQANRLIDDGLQARIASLAFQVRDLSYVLPVDNRSDLRPWHVEGLLPALASSMGGDLKASLAERWSAIEVKRAEARGEGLPVNGSGPQIALRVQSGLQEATTLVEGAWPTVVASPRGPIQAAVSVDVARGLHLRPGKTIELALGPPGTGIAVVIVGLFTVNDEKAAIWDDQSELVHPFEPIGQDGVPWRGVLAVDLSAVTIALAAGMPADYLWRLRIDPRRLDASRLDPLVTAVADARRQHLLPGAALRTGLDDALATFAGEIAAVRALFAIVQTGVLATLFGLMLLAALAIVERRQTELALLRVRGGTAVSIGARLLAESFVVIPAVVAVGWIAALRVPGRAGEADWLAVVFALSAMLAVPVLAGTGRRRRLLARGRDDLVRRRPSARRVTADVGLLGLAALGAFLLRERGFNAEVGVDPYLVSVPVLLAASAAVVGVRVLPWPLRQLGRLAARARGAVAFVGFAGAGRAAPVSVGPLAIMVVAISTGVFSSVAVTSILDGRDLAATQVVPADAVVRGMYFSPETKDRLATVPGVTAVASISVNPAAQLLTATGDGRREIARAVVVVVDGPAFARVLAASGVPTDLPAALTEPGAGQPALAIVSPAVAAELGPAGAATIQGQLYDFRVGAVRETFPSLNVGMARFVVLAQQALGPAPKPVTPTGFLIAGESVDERRLIEIGDDGQRAWKSALPGRPVGGLDLPTTVITRAQYRQDLEASGVNAALSFTFAVGVASGGVLALLAVGFAVVAGARSRGRMLSRLRTMGLSRRQGRRLFAYELLPVFSLGALVGAAVGAALPALTAPALGLSHFTGGVAVGLRLDPRVVAGIVAVIVLGLFAALSIETFVSRRMRLGEVLRLGEET